MDCAISPMTLELNLLHAMRWLVQFGIHVLKVKVTLRLTVGQSVSLGVEPHLGPMARY
jgi:hypothetical protein